MPSAQRIFRRAKPRFSIRKPIDCCRKRVRFCRPFIRSRLGGNRSVNRTVQKQLESLTQNSAQRFNGANRYEVAAKVASSYFPTAKVGMVASGEVFSDALVAAPLSQKLNAPIRLVQKTNLGQSIEAYLKSNKAISLLHVLGGENTVASSVLTKLGEFGRPSNTTMPIVR